MIKITIQPEPMDNGFQATTPSGCWGRGRIPMEAIGDLIITCPELFGVEVEFTEEANKRFGEIQEKNILRYLKD